MQIFDVSMTIEEGMTTYKGDPAFSKEDKLKIKDGDPVNLSVFSLPSHSGTHVDAPSHIEDGAEVTEDIPLSRLVGRVLVVDFPYSEKIQAQDISQLDLSDVRKIFFKTKNSRIEGKEFKEDFTAFSEEAAQELVKAGVKVVGVDYLSVDPYGSDEPKAHKALLDNRVLILEGLNLQEVNPGYYTAFIGPLKVKDADGAPARVLLIEGEVCE